MSTDKKISLLVNEQFPEFLQGETAFIPFLEAYYEWMEETGKTLDVSKNLQQNQDVDTAAEEYYDFLMRELLPSIPKDIAGNKTLFAKYARDFYKAKGNKKSFELLFKLIWGEDISIFLPETLMLRASDGRWIQETSLTIKGPFVGDIFLIQGQYIYGTQSGARARVERIESFLRRGQFYYELYLVDIFSSFADGEQISNLENTTSAYIVSGFGPLSSVRVLDGGAYHNLGNEVSLEEQGIGTGAKGFITELESSSAVEFYIENGGFGFEADNSVINVFGGSGKNASWEISEFANTRPFRYYFDKIHSYRGVRLDLLPEFQTETTNNLSPFIPGPYANGIPNEAWLTDPTRPNQFQDPAAYAAGIQPGTYYSVIDQSLFEPSANLVISNINTPLNKALGSEIIYVSRISKITTTNYGYGYLSLPGTTVINPRFEFSTYDVEESDNIYGWDLDQTNLEYGNAFSGIMGKNAIIFSRNAPGSIKTVLVTAPGLNYTRNNLVDIVNISTNAVGSFPGSGIAQTSGFFKYPGKYTNTNGWLSGTHKLQDNYFYQQFSYVLSSGLLKRTYRKLVDKLVHPAGTIRFDRFLDNPILDASINVPGELDNYDAVNFYMVHNFDAQVYTLSVQPFTNDNHELLRWPVPYDYLSTAGDNFTYTTDEPFGAALPSTTAISIVNTHVIGWFQASGDLYSNTNYLISYYEDQSLDRYDPAPVDFLGTRILLYANNGSLSTEVANTTQPTAVLITQDNAFVNGYFKSVRTYGDTYLLMHHFTANNTNGKTLLNGATFKYASNTVTANTTHPTAEQQKWYFDYDSIPRYPYYLKTQGYPDY